MCFGFWICSNVCLGYNGAWMSKDPKQERPIFNKLTYYCSWYLILSIWLYDITWYYMIIYDYTCTCIWLLLLIHLQCTFMRFHINGGGREGVPTVTVCDYSTCIITHIDQLGLLPNPLLAFEWFSLPSTHTLHCVYYARLGSCVCRISHGLRSARKTAGVCGVANTNRFEVWLFRLSRISIISLTFTERKR